MDIQNLQQKNGTLLAVNEKLFNHRKSNQIFNKLIGSKSMLLF